MRRARWRSTQLRLSKEHPTTWFETPFAGGKLFLVTEERDAYMKAVAEGKLAFSWREMLRLLDADPSRSDLFWALKLKESHPGARIDDILARSVTYPK